MGSQVNFGSRKFMAKGLGELPSPSKSKQYFNFGFVYNSITGAVGITNFTHFTALRFPFPVVLHSIRVFGYYIDTVTSLAKTQPMVSAELLVTGSTGSLNVNPVAYTLGGSSSIESGVNLSGLLGDNIYYDPEIPLFIAPQTGLTFSGQANYFALAAANDALIIFSRFLFEAV